MAMLGEAERGREQILRYMLRHGIDVNSTTSKRRPEYRNYSITLASCAASCSQKRLVKMLVTNFGAEVNNGRSNFLHYALECCALWEYLLPLGADINFADWTSTTPLMSATRRDQPEQCKQLVRLGADLETRDSQGITCLTFAVMDNSPEVADVLLVGGAIMEGVELLKHAVEHGMGRLTSVLLKHGGISKIDNDWSAVRSVIDKFREPYGSHWMDMLLRLKNGGANLDETYQGKPLLCWEVLHQQDLYQQLGGDYHESDTVSILANHVVDIDSTTDDRETALMLACRTIAINHKRNLIEDLLECGADPNIPDRYGRTALLIDFPGPSGVVELAELIMHGADLNVQDYIGQTALHRAVLRGDLLSAEELLLQDIDATLTNNVGHTARYYADGSESVVTNAFYAWQNRHRVTWDKHNDKYIEGSTAS